MPRLQSWKKLKRGDYSSAQTFLQERESFCVGACSRFLTGYNHLWILKNSKGGIAGLLLHSRRSLYPLFSANQDIPLPNFLNRFLQKVPIHSVQGLREDAEILERGMESLGFQAQERIDYDLMTLDQDPLSECFHQGPNNLVLRKPVPEDTEGLFQLQAAYEQEEVLPRDAVFNPAVCRKTLERLLASELILIACLDGKIVGKINTNALSFKCRQIGGVYVRPEYRSRGIAVRMSAVFIRDLLASHQEISLFVKKRNAPARALYRRLGFAYRGDYRISYY